jgi:hypothetical protein
MSSESVCQVARSWVDVGRFHTRLFGFVYVTYGDFHDGSEKGTTRVDRVFCQSWEKCHGDPQNDLARLRVPNLKAYAGVSVACQVQDRSHVSW